MKKRRVVISGIGITSNLGATFAEVTTSLHQGRAAITVDSERQNIGFRSPLKTVLPPTDPRYKVNRRARKYMTEASFYSAITWMKTLDECKLDPVEFTGPDVGVVVGNDSAAAPIPDVLKILEQYHETHFLGSGMVIQTMNSTCSMNLGPLIGAQGINMTLSAACASGAHAVGYAYQLIQSGQQRAIVSGGFQETHWVALASFDALGAFSINTQSPQTASRPFDHQRDGLVPGGGGAILILEDLERAEQLGHPIYGEIIGYGFSSDGSHLTIPTGEGAERCIRNALADAAISPLQIDYINAHATSTPVGDAVEATVINKIFGERGPLVSSTKAMTGHECWMAGASEIIYSLAMIASGFIAANLNFERQEEQTPKINITDKVVATKPEIVLSNSFGFGGTNACLIIKAFTE